MTLWPISSWSALTIASCTASSWLVEPNTSFPTSEMIDHNIWKSVIVLHAENYSSSALPSKTIYMVRKRKRSKSFNDIDRYCLVKWAHLNSFLLQQLRFEFIEVCFHLAVYIIPHNRIQFLVSNFGSLHPYSSQENLFAEENTGVSLLGWMSPTARTKCIFSPLLS